MIQRRTFLTAVAALPFAGLASPALALLRVRKGDFAGRGGHKAAGRVRVAIKHGDATIEFSEDFRFDGAPDAWIALGRNGVIPSTAFARLQRNTGAQAYEVPDGIDAGTHNEVWIWCKQYAEELAVAKLK